MSGGWTMQATTGESSGGLSGRVMQMRCGTCRTRPGLAACRLIQLAIGLVSVLICHSRPVAGRERVE